ncbi:MULTISPECIES: response regulator [Aquimarina]|uniref:Response regulator n=1 Tax=Aquimarina algiphila TaxID=2047982 RepID=A0A554VPF8_9FLAO|nr:MULTISPECIES: response regulator [Aquimarina]TSE10366.1 response regulator [Aquimarina algiphila]
MGLNILLIDDDEIERLKFARVLQKNNYPHNIIEAINGEEALDVLAQKEKLPDLIFLDLNMPKMNGLEFLKELKADATLQYLPVVILSTSNNHQDLKEAYRIGASGYIVKPLKYEDYVHKIKCLIEYWTVNELVKG